MSNEDELKKIKLNNRKYLYLLLQNIEEVFTALGNVYRKLRESEENNKTTLYNKIFEKFSKLLLFTSVLIVFGFSYYFYIYVRIFSIF